MISQSARFGQIINFSNMQASIAFQEAYSANKPFNDRSNISFSTTRGLNTHHWVATGEDIFIVEAIINKLNSGTGSPFLMRQLSEMFDQYLKKQSGVSPSSTGQSTVQAVLNEMKGYQSIDQVLDAMIAAKNKANKVDYEVVGIVRIFQLCEQSSTDFFNPNVIGKIRKKIAMFTHPDRGASPEKIDLGKSLNAHLDLMEKSSSVIKNILSRNGI